MSKPARQQIGITQAQRRMLFAARKKLGMDEEAYRGLLERVAGVRSSADLDQVGFDIVLRALERAGFRNTSRDKPFGARPGFATGRQVALITKLAGELWGETADRGLSSWLRHFHHVEHLRFVGFDQASAVIEGLKAMRVRKEEESGTDVG